MVKTIRAISIIIYLFSWLACAHQEELFLRANKLYSSHEYDQALGLYQMISTKGRAVLYNIGNCYFHKNDYARALVYWERAKKGATSQEYTAIEHNKNYILEKLHKTKINSVSHSLKELAHKVHLYMSPFFLQLLFFLLWGILLFLYYKGHLKSIRIVLFLIIILLACVIFIHHMERSVRYGIIINKHTKLYAGPDKGFDTIGLVDYADSVVIKENRQGWYKVISFDTIGWINADAIEII